ncbi:MAG: aldo/keto reductase [Coriobacteriia bacterium]|nr:aldo/keto reductase [Coriobacteriia bacterium]
MQYVSFGQTGMEVSRLGLGCMRFPPDKAESIEMVRYAIDHGVNYLDTAYVYEGSEEILGEALADGYRQRIRLASKAPMWSIQSYGDFEKRLDESLMRLKTDYLDVYLLHNLYQGNLDKARRLDGPGFLDEMIAKGKILYKGFSMHNTYEAFTDLVDDYRWDMAQIQLNILDVNMQVGLKGLEYGAEKGIAMVIMEGLRGGQILQSQPQEVDGLLAAHPEQRPLVDWCYRWLYDKPAATMILSGTSSLEQLKQNLEIFEQSEYGVMSDADARLISRIRREYQKGGAIGCTSCRYCMPCKEGVLIPDIFSVYNNFIITGRRTMSDKVYYRNGLVARGAGADRCVKCGECTERCPQKLPVQDLLPGIHEELTADLPARFLQTD